jgi:hypothetical protein
MYFSQLKGTDEEIGDTGRIHNFSMTERGMEKIFWQV